MSEWIKVNERLPEPNTTCLWFDGYSSMSGKPMMYVDKIVATEYGFDCIGNYLHNYTHWMPLPQPPETDK